MEWYKTLIDVAEADWIERGKMNLQGIVDVPEGQVGDWVVGKMTLDEEQSMATMFSMKDRMVPAGSYTRLKEGGTLYMSDTPTEMGDHVPLIKALMDGGGVQRVLVFGLGLGMVMEMIMEAHNTGRLCIDHVLFVEKSQDVIDLVAPHYLAKYPDQFEVVCADAFDYEPGSECYEAVWIDIWASPDPEYACDAELLMDTWRDHTDWVGCWMEDALFSRGEYTDEALFYS